MFNRFTRAAKEAVIETQRIALEQGSDRIDTEHLLLTLSQDGEVRFALETAGDVTALRLALEQEIRSQGLDGEALASLGIDLEEVSRRTDEVFGAGALSQAKRKRGHIPFTREAKKALELALREAVRLKDRSIGTRHLLLGLLRADCPARSTLTAQGFDLGVLRARLERPEAESA